MRKEEFVAGGRFIVVNGDYALAYKTYIGEHAYTSHDIEIVKKYPSEKDENEFYLITIGDFKDGDFVSAGLRVFDQTESRDDFMCVYELARIALEILELPCVPVFLK